MNSTLVTSNARRIARSLAAVMTSSNGLQGTFHVSRRARARTTHCQGEKRALGKRLDRATLSLGRYPYRRQVSRRWVMNRRTAWVRDPHPEDHCHHRREGASASPSRPLGRNQCVG
jgi:hypothetical protein